MLRAISEGLPDNKRADISRFDIINIGKVYIWKEYFLQGYLRSVKLCESQFLVLDINGITTIIPV